MFLLIVLMTAAFGSLSKGRNSSALCQRQGWKARWDFVSFSGSCFGGGGIGGSSALPRGSPARPGRRNHQRPRRGRNFPHRGSLPTQGHDAPRTGATTSPDVGGSRCRLDSPPSRILLVVQQRAIGSRESRCDRAGDARGVAGPAGDGFLAETDLGLFHVRDRG